jgi:hypothetical protein
MAESMRGKGKNFETRMRIAEGQRLAHLLRRLRAEREAS